MGRKVQANRFQAIQVKALNIGRGRLEYHLELVVLEETVWILAVPPVGGPTRRLDVSDAIRVRPEHTEKRFGVHRPCPNLNVVGLLDYAPSIAPIFLQLKDEVLKCRAP
jgi:hypothetical protein